MIWAALKLGLGALCCCGSSLALLVVALLVWGNAVGRAGRRGRM